MKQMVLKNDKYRRARGGRSRLLDIFCVKCATLLMVYQKDGPGPLKRGYFDRIMTPFSPRLLKCKKCHHVIGVPYVYPKEQRKAFLLELGSITKKQHTSL